MSFCSSLRAPSSGGMRPASANTEFGSRTKHIFPPASRTLRVNGRQLRWRPLEIRVAVKLFLYSLSRSICIALLLAGPIPRELGNLAALQSLDLGANTLSGEPWRTN
ncbi:unnamed protein product [Ectocarpus sp. 12 AP-2014]